MKPLLFVLAFAVSLSITERPTAMEDAISSSGAGWQGSEYEKYDGLSFPPEAPWDHSTSLTCILTTMQVLQMISNSWIETVQDDT